MFDAVCFLSVFDIRHASSSRARLLAIIAFVVLAGCASSAAVQRPMHTALEEMTNEVSSRGDPILDFSSSISINGLGRSQTAGGMIYFPKGLPDAYSVSVSP